MEQALKASIKMPDYVPKPPPKESINISSINPISLLLQIIFFGVIFLGIFYVVIITFPTIAAKVTPANLENLLAEKITIKSDINLSREVKPLFEVLKPHLDESLLNMKVGVINTDKENAFAFLGHSVYLTKGFLKNAQFKNEKLFVLAHEIGHVKYQDPLKGLYTNFLFEVVYGLFGNQNSFSRLALKATTLSYSRAQEKKADLFALELLYKATGSVKGASNFFKRMSKEHGYWEGMSAGLFSTHPVSKERIEYLKEASKAIFERKNKN